MTVFCRKFIALFVLRGRLVDSDDILCNIIQVLLTVTYSHDGISSASLNL